MDIKNFLYVSSLSQSEFAILVGISRAALSNYIAKRRVPTLEIAHRIFKASKGMVTLKDLNYKRKHFK